MIASQLESVPAPAAAATWEPAPLILARFAGQSRSIMLQLKLSRTVALLEQIAALDEQLETATAALCDALFPLIGGLDGAQRAQLVAIKRNIFNRRQLTSAERQVFRDQAFAHLRRPLLQTQRGLAKLSRLERQARQIFDAELRSKRALLQAACRDEEFQKAVQIASPALAQGLPRYLRADPAQLRSRERKVELGAFHYLMRMSTKTSPFGRFGPTALGRWSHAAPHGLQISAPAPARRTVSQLRRECVHALAEGLSLHPALMPHLRPSLNRSAYRDGDTIVFRPPLQVHQRSAPRRLKPLPLVELIMDTLGSAPHTRTLAEWVERWAAALDTPAAAIQPVVGQLIKSGFIRNTLTIASNDRAPFDGLISQLAALDTPAAAELLDHVRAISAISASYASAPVAERQRLQQHLDSHIAAALAHWPAYPQLQTMFSAALIEDSTWDGVQLDLGGPWWQALSADLATLIECIFRRDDGGMPRARLLDAYEQLVGSGHAAPNLLDFASTYEQQAASLASASSPRCARIYQHMQTYLDTLEQRIAAASDQPEVLLDRAELAQLAEQFAPSSAASSVAIHAQLVADDAQALASGEGLLVLNFALPGFARFLLRYEHLLDAHDRAALHGYAQSLIDDVCAELPAAVDTAELLTTLQNSQQIHAPLSPRAIVPPDEHSGNPDVASVELRDLGLQHDAASDTLRLIEHTRADQPLVPLYLGALHMAALPPLYRMLATLAPTSYHMEMFRPGDYRRYGFVSGMPADIEHTPRVRVGRVVLQRERWLVPAAALPALAPSSDDFSVFQTWFRWFRRHRLPREVFVRIGRSQPGDSQRPANDLKPFFVDTENFFALLMLQRDLDDGVATLEIEEMLPSLRHAGVEIGDQTYVVEFQLELNRKGAHL